MQSINGPEQSFVGSTEFCAIQLYGESMRSFQRDNKKSPPTKRYCREIRSEDISQTTPDENKGYLQAT